MKILLHSIATAIAGLAIFLPSAAASAATDQKHAVSGARHHGHARPHHSGRHHSFHHRHWGPSSGLYFSLVPPAYTRFWYGGSPYFVADGGYYLSGPGGYRLIPPATGEDTPPPTQRTVTPPVPSHVSPTDALVITPLRDQTATQKSFDRIECERTAMKATGYDPAVTVGAALVRAEYVKAVAACLTGMGYNVK